MDPDLEPHDRLAGLFQSLEDIRGIECLLAAAVFPHRKVPFFRTVKRKPLSMVLTCMLKGSIGASTYILSPLAGKTITPRGDIAIKMESRSKIRERS
jgi:hypothetical protein